MHARLIGLRPKLQDTKIKGETLPSLKAILSPAVPWWGKIAAKLVLSRVPLSYSAWSKIGVFRHGQMNLAAYAIKTFEQHLALAKPCTGFVVLELGPGDAIASAILTPAFGGSASYQVDVGTYATRDLTVYRKLALACEQRGHNAPSLEGARTLEDLQDVCNANYMTEGLKSLKDIPESSVDFIYSQSCIEHIRLAELPETMVELRRILRPGGVASHWVDLQDHLGGRLNNLRVKRSLWEADWFAGSGFYTNRVRYSQLCQMARDAGFEVTTSAPQRWEALPTRKQRMAEEYRCLPDNELNIKGFNLICR